jgi:hypothetical protein
VLERRISAHLGAQGPFSKACAAARVSSSSALAARFISSS